jgi:MFS family permease
VHTSRRAWLVWGVGVLAYIVAVLHRTSLGVAGIEAQHRFGASASVLASFAVLQLLVYAGLQVPVGVALDRFGARRLIVVGATVMALGQLLLATSSSVPGAVVARVLVGAGDAMTFISVLRLVPAWFDGRRVPLLTQLTGIVGQIGQILSAVPLVAVLHTRGWTTAFTSAAALGLLAAVLAFAVVRDAPSGHATRSGPPTLAQVGRDLVEAWQHPGTRLGLWTHFVSQYSGTVFALLWGFPFLVSGEGRSHSEASALLTVQVLVGMATGPVMGVLVVRHPLRRSWLVLGVVAAAVTGWTVVLAWPGQAPLWVLTGLVVALALGGPGSMIAFDFARTFNPPNRLGTATGIVNVGGFVASLATMLLVGLILDARTGGGTDYSLSDFRIALSVQFVMWAVGIGGVLRTRRLVRRRMAAAGVVVPPIREAIRRNRSRRR